MPKATLNTRSGAVVTIEGSQDELAAILARLEGVSGEDEQPRPSKPTRLENAARPTPGSLLAELTDEGFFSRPQELGAVRIALQEKGHFYPVTTLSPLMLRLVRKKELRRLKSGKHWTYVR